ncbi:hypothetical protein F2Q69_00013181 [Brassica cretica]|uniref:ATP-dependent RNA helicase Ski2/MTR4 C-terminal domain-containing protein n=1 Tax=Brassica cretica TaxID=69181 RepID=A0A8S9QPW5_BRACR|nr:hypothetical protein F2Q69_00013181 [Brassica cretica]
MDGAYVQWCLQGSEGGGVGERGYLTQLNPEKNSTYSSYSYKTQPGVDIDFESFVHSFRPDIMEAVYAWAKGSKFYEIDGDCLCFRREHDQSDKKNGGSSTTAYSSCKKSIGETQLEAKLEEAVSKIKRSIIFAASVNL